MQAWHCLQLSLITSFVPSPIVIRGEERGPCASPVSLCCYNIPAPFCGAGVLFSAAAPGRGMSCTELLWGAAGLEVRPMCW